MESKIKRKGNKTNKTKMLQRNRVANAENVYKPDEEETARLVASEAKRKAPGDEPATQAQPRKKPCCSVCKLERTQHTKEQREACAQIRKGYG